MKPVDLSGLIKGLMVVIGIAIALGKYDQLAAWARREAFGGILPDHHHAVAHKAR